MTDDMWHVQIEPGDVKTVTLEQMDDMYRLDLISGSTLVWQPGMPKALPLSVIAGIEEPEEEEIMEIEPELIPEPALPAMAQRQPTMTPPPAPVVNATPAAAPQMPTPDFYSPESLRPITMSGMPTRQRSGGTLGGRLVMGVAIAAGVLITLHRNDLLRPMASSAGSEAAYQQLEVALGGPGFGTTRAVTEFSTLLNPPTTEAEQTTSAASASSDAQDEADTSSEGESDADSESSTAANTGNNAAPAKKKAKKQRQATPARRHAPVQRKAPSPGGKKLKSFQGSEYDPMNAKL